MWLSEGGQTNRAIPQNRNCRNIFIYQGNSFRTEQAWQTVYKQADHFIRKICIPTSKYNKKSIQGGLKSTYEKANSNTFKKIICEKNFVNLQ